MARVFPAVVLKLASAPVKPHLQGTPPSFRDNSTQARYPRQRTREFWVFIFFSAMPANSAARIRNQKLNPNPDPDLRAPHQDLAPHKHSWHVCLTAALQNGTLGSSHCSHRAPLSSGGFRSVYQSTTFSGCTPYNSVVPCVLLPARCVQQQQRSAVGCQCTTAVFVCCWPLWCQGVKKRQAARRK